MLIAHRRRFHPVAALALLSVVAPAHLFAQNARRGTTASSIKVGPPHGTVMVVGGGSMGPDVYAQFIAAAGGPDALIIDVPTAGGAATYDQDAPGTRGWKAAGAKHIYVLHTTDRKLADSDSFAAILKKAGGVWFEGGRQFHLVDSYAGTKTEQGFHDVLARGGVIGGSSAGASILGDFLVRGAPSNNNFIMDSPGYEKGFAFLRGVGIDQHVVARERLRDLADSIMPKYPKLLGMSEDEGTVWVVRGDTATIIGRDKAFVYGGNDPTDPGKPFLTLHPGDKYNLASRHIIHRASADAPFQRSFVDDLFRKYSDESAGGATVLVARGGEVYVDTSYGIPAQAKYMPPTTVPQFALGDLSKVFSDLCDQLPPPPAGRGRGRGGAPDTNTKFQNCVTRQLGTPVGWHKTNATPEGVVQSDVDELYRFELGLENERSFIREPGGATQAGSPNVDFTRGWQVDKYHGAARWAAYGAAGGKRDAFIRLPDQHAVIIILTNDESADVKAIGDRIADKLIGK